MTSIGTGKGEFPTVVVYPDHPPGKVTRIKREAGIGENTAKQKWKTDQCPSYNSNMSWVVTSDHIALALLTYMIGGRNGQPS